MVLPRLLFSSTKTSPSEGGQKRKQKQKSVKQLNWSEKIVFSERPQNMN